MWKDVYPVCMVPIVSTVPGGSVERCECVLWVRDCRLATWWECVMVIDSEAGVSGKAGPLGKALTLSESEVSKEMCVIRRGGGSEWCGVCGADDSSDS